MSSVEHRREYQRGYRERRRLRVHELLGGRCEGCGTVESLQVHHRNPKDKSFTLGRSWTLSWERILAELPKCILLCADCHRGHHKWAKPHGTPHRYWAGCRCLSCTAANTAYFRERRKLRRVLAAARAFGEEMRAHGIHVGVGKPPICVVCDVEWPCHAAAPDGLACFADDAAIGH